MPPCRLVGYGGDIDAVSLTSWLAAGAPVVPGVIRPPALVAEYLGGGSLRGALSRGLDYLRSELVRAKLALDAARVRVGGWVATVDQGTLRRDTGRWANRSASRLVQTT